MQNKPTGDADQLPDTSVTENSAPQKQIADESKQDLKDALSDRVDRFDELQELLHISRVLIHGRIRAVPRRIGEFRVLEALARFDFRPVPR